MDAKKIALAALIFLAFAAGAGFCGDGAQLQPGGTVLSVAFLSIDRAPLAGEKVTFTLGGKDVSAYTDANGMASVGVDASGEVVASVRKNDYNYSFIFNVDADGSPKSEIAALAPLLKIESFESAPDGHGCYSLSANVSDPRKNKPISIKMLQIEANGTQAGDIRVALDENSIYSGNVCAVPGMSVKVVASNAYETAEKTILLAEAAKPEPPAPAVTPPPQNATAAPPAAMPKPMDISPLEMLSVALVGVVIFVMIIAASVLVLGRANPHAAGGMAKYFSRTWGIFAGSAVRPIVEYLRSLIKKKEPPPISAFGQ